MKKKLFVMVYFFIISCNDNEKSTFLPKPEVIPIIMTFIEHHHKYDDFVDCLNP